MVTLSVPAIHCGHCKASVEAALKPIDGTRYVRVDMDTRQVTIGGSPRVEDLIGALGKIGFPAEIVTA